MNVRTEDTCEIAHDFSRARLYQTALGLGFALVGVAALALGELAAGASLLAVGMGLVPTKTLLKP